MKKVLLILMELQFKLIDLLKNIHIQSVKETANVITTIAIINVVVTEVLLIIK